VDIVEVLRNNARYPDGSPGMVQGVESDNNPKDSARSMNEDVGQNSPCATNRQKQSNHQEKYDTRPRRGQQSHIEEI
jgi:hypothetical protein